MKKTNKKALFIVDSPFQCLCMIEAIDYFNLIDFDIIVTYSNNFSIEKVDRLLKQHGFIYETLWLSHLLKDTIPFFFKKHKHYKRIFIGNFASPHSYAVAVLHATTKAELCYLDDGNQALVAFSKTPPMRKPNRKVDIFMSFISLLHRIKRIGKDSFFTIYDVESKKYNIIHNPLNTLRRSTVAKPKGVYIIGTKSSGFDFRDADYITYLRCIKEKFGKGQTVYYCPHRQDTNNNMIFEFCEEIGIEVFNTEISVEMDFIKREIYPDTVLGFGSNALYVLHKIFPQTVCLSIVFHTTSDYSNTVYDIIRMRMKQSGIGTINVL